MRAPRRNQIVLLLEPEVVLNPGRAPHSRVPDDRGQLTDRRLRLGRTVRPAIGTTPTARTQLTRYSQPRAQRPPHAAADAPPAGPPPTAQSSTDAPSALSEASGADRQGNVAKSYRASRSTPSPKWCSGSGGRISCRHTSGRPAPARVRIRNDGITLASWSWICALSRASRSARSS